MVAHIDDYPHRGRQGRLAQQDAVDQIFEFDLAAADLTESDIADVYDILERDEVYGGFTLVVAHDGVDQRYEASEGEFAPPLANIQAHFSALIRDGAAPRPDISASARELVDEESDLRLYRVVHESWGDDVQPRPIIISMRYEQVIG